MRFADVQMPMTVFFYCFRANLFAVPLSLPAPLSLLQHFAAQY